jgi:5-formyltetrahydrofolate cyclo-ligase
MNPPDINPTKAALRRSLKQARLALSSEERQAKSTAIASRLWQAVDWSAVTSLHCFEPIERLGEVDISDFIEVLRDEYPNIHVFTSRQVNKIWQIVSLTNGKPIPESRLHDESKAPLLLQFDVILVPMLGFDPQTLHRIGYGGGYYDRFLAAQSQARAQPQSQPRLDPQTRSQTSGSARAQKIGLCFDLGKLENLPTELHDIPLDAIITESIVYEKGHS